MDHIAVDGIEVLVKLLSSGAWFALGVMIRDLWASGRTVDGYAEEE